MVTMFFNQGVRLGIGTDWTASGSMHMGRELACAAYLNETHYGGFFTDRELWLMATQWNAEALKIDDVVGSLAVGLYGDVAIFDGGAPDAPYVAALAANADSTALVLRGGTPLYGDATLVAGVTGGALLAGRSLRSLRPLGPCRPLRPAGADDLVVEFEFGGATRVTRGNQTRF